MHIPYCSCWGIFMHNDEIQRKGNENLGLQAWQILENLFLITLGSILCGIAVNGILIPHRFFSAGFAGVTLIIHYLTPTVSPGLIYLLINIPVFILGWKLVGRRFFLYSLAGMFIFSLCLYFVHVPIPVHDKIISAILAGIINGAGVGLILRSFGSSGGTDILSVILMNKFSISIGNTSLITNAVILGCAAFLFSTDSALYTLVSIYVGSKVMDLVVVGLSRRKAVLIVSEHWEEISNEILKKERRGITILEGRGAYTGKGKNVLYTVIAFRDLPRLKEMLRRVDPDAFVVFMDTLEVMGHRIGNQPHW